MNYKNIILSSRVRIIDIIDKDNALFKDLKIKSGDIIKAFYDSAKACGGRSAHIEVINETNNLSKTTYLQYLHSQLNRYFVFEQI